MSRIETTNKILKGAAGYTKLFAEVPLTGGGMFSTQGMSLALQGESYDRRNPPKMQYDLSARAVCIHMNKRVYTRSSIIPEDAAEVLVGDLEAWTGSLRGLPNCVVLGVKNGECTIKDFTVGGEEIVIRSEEPVFAASRKGLEYIQAWTGAGCNSYTRDGTLIAREIARDGLRYEDLGDALVDDEAPFIAFLERDGEGIVAHAHYIALKAPARMSMALSHKGPIRGVYSLKVSKDQLMVCPSTMATDAEVAELREKYSHGELHSRVLDLLFDARPLDWCFLGDDETKVLALYETSPGRGSIYRIPSPFTVNVMYPLNRLVGAKRVAMLGGLTVHDDDNAAMCYGRERRIAYVAVADKETFQIAEFTLSEPYENGGTPIVEQVRFETFTFASPQVLHTNTKRKVSYMQISFDASTNTLIVPALHHVYYIDAESLQVRAVFETAKYVTSAVPTDSGVAVFSYVFWGGGAGWHALSSFHLLDHMGVEINQHRLIMHDGIFREAKHFGDNQIRVLFDSADDYLRVRSTSVLTVTITEQIAKVEGALHTETGISVEGDGKHGSVYYPKDCIQWPRSHGGYIPDSVDSILWELPVRCATKYDDTHVLAVLATETLEPSELSLCLVSHVDVPVHNEGYFVLMLEMANRYTRVAESKKDAANYEMVSRLLKISERLPEDALMLIANSMGMAHDARKIRDLVDEGETGKLSLEAGAIRRGNGARRTLDGRNLERFRAADMRSRQWAASQTLRPQEKPQPQPVPKTGRGNRRENPLLFW